MFDLPDTKRVRRNELRSSSPSPAHDIDASSLPALTFDFDFVTVAEPTPHLPAPVEEKEEEEHEFNLFSGSTGPTQRLRVKSPTPPPDAWDIAAANQSRPISYYILSPADLLSRRKELASAVISGAEVLAHSRDPWYGCRLEWRVTHIPGTRGPPEKSEDRGKRRRPNKKRRIVLRVERKKEEMRQKSILGRQKMEGLSKEEKDRLNAENKKRKNREKQLRRREKERAKKAAASTGSGDATGARADQSAEAAE